MATQMGGQPVYILSEGAQRYLGRDARRMNIMASRVVAEAVKSTLGPRGMDKMLVDTTGDVVITNDGAAILKEVDVKHPAAKMMVEIAETQEKEAGDGTTTVVVLAGELLKRAEELIEQDMHATVIANGYRLAEEEAMRILSKIGKKVAGSKAELEGVALTSLNSKAPGITAKEHIARLSVEAVLRVSEEEDGKRKVDKDNIKIQKQVGGSTGDSELVEGIVLDKEKAHAGMPKHVKKAKIALLTTELKIKKTETDAKLDITSPEQLEAFIQGEEESLRDMAKKIKDAGANVLFCQKDIEDIVGYHLSKEEIIAVKSASEKDIKILSRATGAKIVSNLKDISKKDLGGADSVAERKLGDKTYVFVEGCHNPKAVTLLLRGGSEHVVEETERSVDDAVSVARNVLEDSLILPGGGAVEMALSRQLSKVAGKVGGREQLAFMEFAKALEIVPKTLVENAGLDPIDALIDLRRQHEKGNSSYGIDLSTGKARDMYKAGVVESFRVVQQLIKSATEAATMILRIDDVIAAKGALGGEGGMRAPAMPPGMGGMGGMPPM